MALYDYKCSNENCEAIQEVKHKITETPAIKCCICEAPSKKIISAAGFSLKGDGWYKSGYSGK